MLGTYSIDENGDTTLTDYGVYKVEDGALDVRQGHQGQRPHRVAPESHILGREADRSAPGRSRPGRPLPPPWKPPAFPRSAASQRLAASSISDVRADPRPARAAGLLRDQRPQHDGNLTRLGENLVAGISNGAIWALVAIGYTLVYGIVELINFAHGEVFMIGSFISASFFATIGLTRATSGAILFFGLLLTLFVAMVASGSLNVLIERVAYQTTAVGAPKLAPLITAVGISFILQNVGLLWRGGSQQGIADLINAQHTLVHDLRRARSRTATCSPSGSRSRC